LVDNDGSAAADIRPSSDTIVHAGLPPGQRLWAILSLCFGTGLAVIDGSVVTVALPTLAGDFGVKSSAAVLVVTVYQLVLVMTLLPFSALGYRIGLRRLYQYGQWIFLLSTVLCFFARSLPFLLVVRALQALGGAASLSVMSALIRSIYPSSQLGRGLALNSVVVSLGAAIAPTLGGLVLSVASWPWIFAAGAPLALFSLLLGRRTLPPPVPRDEPFDVLGALLCALTFGLIISGLESAVDGDSPVISTVIVIFGAVMAFVFVRRELESRIPILPVDLLAQPLLGLSVLGGFLAFIASMTMLLSLPFRLEQQFGFSPGEVGALLTPWPLSIMVIGPLAGLFADRFSPAFMGLIGMTASAVGLLSLAFLPDHVTHVQLAWRMMLSGAGFGLFLVPNARLIVHASPMRRSASAGALISTTRLVGQTLGATLLSALLSMGLGVNRTPAFVAAALASLAGLCSVLGLRAGSRRRVGSSEKPLIPPTRGGKNFRC
jgi:MFS transporter, DHA2 family, multidrug resistance protein